MIQTFTIEVSSRFCMLLYHPWFILARGIKETLGSLSKHDVDGTENVIWKCNFAFGCNHFKLFRVIMLEKCVLTILELTCNQRLGHKTKLNICHHMLTSSTQLQDRSFHVVERTRTSSKCQKLKKCTCKACKNTVFHRQICKFVGFLLPWSSWLIKLFIGVIKP